MIPAIWRTEAERTTEAGTPERRRGAAGRDQAVLGRDRRHRRRRRARRLPDPDRVQLAVGRRPDVGHQGARSWSFTGFYVVCAAGHLVRLPPHGRREVRRHRAWPGAGHLSDHDQDPLPLLQPAVRHDPRAHRAARWRSQPWPEFPVNEGALCRKGWTATGLRGHRERLTTPLVRDRATGELRAATWDEALDLVADAARASCGTTHGADAVAVFGGGGLTNEKAYQLGKFARVALGHQPDRLQRPVVHVVGRVGRQPGLRDRPRAAVPAGRPRADRRAGPGRLQPRRDDAAGGPAPRPAPRARRPGRRDRPAAHADRRPRRPVPPAGARHRPAARARAAAPARRRRRGRRGVRRRAHHRLRRRYAARPPPGGPSGSSG